MGTNESSKIKLNGKILFQIFFNLNNFDKHHEKINKYKGINF